MGKKAEPGADEPDGGPDEDPGKNPVAKSKAQGKPAEEAEDEDEAPVKKPRKKRDDDSDDEEGGFGDEDSEDEEEEGETGDEGEASADEAKPRVPVKVTLPEERWHVAIKIDEIQEALDLVDLKKLFGAYMTIKKKFFDDLLTTMPNVRHYSAGKAIESVGGFDKQDWTKNSWIMVMAKEAKNKVVFWMLFKRLEDLSGMLVAIGPDAFAESITGLFPDDPDSRSEYLKKLMIWLTIEPSRWKGVGVFIPNWV
ncbi:MAG: hypothetical protein JW839_23075 [Candidatus Lokiarchaeota archaeon]|nr:hypothetical protein [Candidatus Lokiarchaeota archaeon]